MAVSLRVPDEIKRRIEKLAAAQAISPHAFMVTAIRERLEAEEARAKFHAEGRRRLANMKKTGVDIPADEVHAYLMHRAEGTPAKRPKARRRT